MIKIKEMLHLNDKAKVEEFIEDYEILIEFNRKHDIEDLILVEELNLLKNHLEKIS